MTKSFGAQRANQRVVNKTFLFLQDLVALLIGTRGLEPHDEFILHQKLSFNLPPGTRLDPFERTARAAKRIEDWQDGACFLVQPALVNR